MTALYLNKGRSFFMPFSLVSLIKIPVAETTGKRVLLIKRLIT